MSHIYSDTFFDYIDAGARRSAQRFIGLLQPWLDPQSVLDLGSGRGVWLAEWQAAGVQDVVGVDGDYVDRDGLAIPPDQFLAADLTRPVETGRRFDLAQSLEVGEHLPPRSARTLVKSLCAASDRVLFSAAVPGQGGECHVNERPLAYWQTLFAEEGYRAFDCLRPRLRGAHEVEPWYRYNAVLYANEAGQSDLPDAVRNTGLPAGVALADGGDAVWRLRRTVVRCLPRGAVTMIAQKRAAILARRARQAATA